MELFIENLQYAAAHFIRNGVTVTVDFPHYSAASGALPQSAEQALYALERAGAANVRLLLTVGPAPEYDITPLSLIRQHVKKIGHIRFVDNVNPTNAKAVQSNYSHVLRELEAMGYSGFISAGGQLSASEKMGFRLLSGG